MADRRHMVERVLIAHQSRWGVKQLTEPMLAFLFVLQALEEERRTLREALAHALARLGSPLARQLHDELLDLLDTWRKTGIADKRLRTRGQIRVTLVRAADDVARSPTQLDLARPPAEVERGHDEAVRLPTPATAAATLGVDTELFVVEQQLVSRAVEAARDRDVSWTDALAASVSSSDASFAGAEIGPPDAPLVHATPCRAATTPPTMSLHDANVRGSRLGISERVRRHAWRGVLDLQIFVALTLAMVPERDLVRVATLGGLWASAVMTVYLLVARRGIARRARRFLERDRTFFARHQFLLFPVLGMLAYVLATMTFGWITGVQEVRTAGLAVGVPANVMFLFRILEDQAEVLGTTKSRCVVAVMLRHDLICAFGLVGALASLITMGTQREGDAAAASFIAAVLLGCVYGLSYLRAKASVPAVATTSVALSGRPTAR